MAVCETYRIPRSEFLSWPEDDQDIALAAELRRRETCPGCGAHHADKADLDAITERCDLCERVEEERAEIPDIEKGVHVKVVPLDVAVRMRQEHSADPFQPKG